jgi:hypothetical protein
MPAALVREREAIAAFHRRVLLWAEALVDDDAALIEEHRTEAARAFEARPVPTCSCKLRASGSSPKNGARLGRAQT